MQLWTDPKKKSNPIKTDRKSRELILAGDLNGTTTQRSRRITHNKRDKSISKYVKQT